MKMVVEKVTVEAPASFELAPSGPLDRAHRRLRIVGDDAPRVVRRAIATGLIAWLPLLVASLVTGNQAGTTIDFAHDIAVHVRFLVVVPLLILAEASIGPRSRMVVGEFVQSGLIGEEDLPRFAAIVQRGKRLVNSVLAEALLVVVTIGLLWVAFRVVTAEQSMFWFERATEDGVAMTPAGWWYSFVAMPIAIFLVVRWGWRYVVWSWFLRRVSKLNLRLSATHPDLVGGLGFVSFNHGVFAILSFALGCGVSAAAGNRIIYAGAELRDHQFAILGFAVLAIVVGVAPLLSFTPALARLKQAGIIEYGRLASDYVQSFDRKWVSGKPPRDETLLGSGDIQSLADIGGSFQRVSAMRPFLIDRRIIFFFAVAAIVPTLPLLLTVMPLKDMAQLLVKLLV
jgi:hypothetical protein